MDEKEFAKGLVKVVMDKNFKPEVCPYCGDSVVSLALHNLSCPKIREYLDDDGK